MLPWYYHRPLPLKTLALWNSEFVVEFVHPCIRWLDVSGEKKQPEEQLLWLEWSPEYQLLPGGLHWVDSSLRLALVFLQLSVVENYPPIWNLCYFYVNFRASSSLSAYVSLQNQFQELCWIYSMILCRYL